MKAARWLLCLGLLGASGWVHGAESDTSAAQRFSAKVIAVLDGDTVLILREGGGVAAGHPPASPLRGKRSNGLAKVRLAEIDAPEKAQIFGETAKRSLAEMVLGKQVQVASQAVDQYGRLVAHLRVGELDVNAEQIRRGMAWEYSHFHSNHALVALQAEAQQAPRGLWVLSDPVPPWEWRKQHPNVQSEPPHTPVPAGNRAAADPGAACGSKKFCSEMSSCEEARHYLTQCGLKRLDGNGDGVPCESLCGGMK